jgi:hypothetical protein
VGGSERQVEESVGGYMDLSLEGNGMGKWMDW